MKSAVSLMLIVCLVASAVPVAAQEKTETRVLFGTPGSTSPPTASPLAQAVRREARRLAAEVAAGDAVQQRDNRAESDWSRVRKLGPGTEITVTANGLQPGQRYVLSADESGITVLNLASPTLSAAAHEVLRDHASRNPAHFRDAHTGGTFLLDKNVRLGSDGVFVADRKVADLEQIVERTARTDVVEIRRKPAPRHPVRKGALIGAAAGFGTVLAIVASDWPAGCRDCAAAVLFYGGFFGGIGAGAGAGIGALVGRSKQATAGLVYRAP